MQCYDLYGRAEKSAATIGSTTLNATQSFDTSGRPDVSTYPSGYAIKNLYNAAGYLERIVNAANTSQIFWQGTTLSAYGRFSAENRGPAALTRTLDAMGKVRAVSAASSITLVSSSVKYDELQNVVERAWTDGSQGRTESFSYDALNRLSMSQVTGLSAKSYAYSASGSLTSKDGIGSYTYPAGSAARPHAVSAIAGTVGGVANPAYEYDANGNLITERQGGSSGPITRALTVASYNLPTLITQGANSDAFNYGPEHARVRQIATVGGVATTILYGAGYEDVSVSTGGWERKHYVSGPDGLVAIVTMYGNGATDIKRVFGDHLGSTSVMTDENGWNPERLSYDSWGKRRDVSGADNASASSSERRGYTGHEHLDSLVGRK